MKHKKRKLIIAAIIAALIYSVMVYKDALIKSFVAAAATQITGAEVRIGKLSFDILDSNIHIKGLKVYNPAGFPKEVFIDIPSIEVEYDLSALLRRDLHLVSAEFVLKEVVVIRDKEGRLNVNSLKIAQKKNGEESRAKEAERKAMPMRIDLLKLDIGRVVHKDYSKGDKPVIDVYNINIRKTYKDIRGASQLITLILAESLKGTAVKGAKIYGVAALAGAAALPVGVAGVLISKDSAKSDFAVGYEEAYKASEDAADELGDIVKKDAAQGYIKARIQGANVTVTITKMPDSKTSIVVSARKYMLPSLNTAEGLLYEISRKLKIAP